MAHPSPLPTPPPPTPTPESIARSVAKLRAAGLTVALTEDGKLSVQPADSIPEASHKWLGRNGPAVIDLLRTKPTRGDGVTVPLVPAEERRPTSMRPRAPP